MKQAVELIVANTEQHPEFRYYISIMKKAERNLSNQPDICIEACKALLEGVSKSIIQYLNPNLLPEKENSKDADWYVKKAAQCLKVEDNVIEDNFVARCCSLANALSALRNERGDISHGKAVPKLVSSNEQLSKLCMSMTENVLCYMLDAFFSLSPKQDETVEQSKVIDEQATDLPILSYDDYNEFNDWLDDQYPLPEGRVIYSVALFELYYEDYVIQLEEYQGNLEGLE